MTVAVLNPQDCLNDYRISKQPLISPPPTMKYPRNSSPNFNRNNRNQPNRRKRSPPRHQSTPQPTRAAVSPKQPSKNNLVMGQVKILKRGEELNAAKPIQAPEPEKKAIQKKVEADLGSTDRLGPDPGSVPVQIRLAESKNRSASFYAGSAFVTSPPPSSLPLPAFFTKKSVTIKNDDATSDLRRILKLDLL